MRGFRLLRPLTRERVKFPEGHECFDILEYALVQHTVRKCPIQFAFVERNHSSQAVASVPVGLY